MITFDISYCLRRNLISHYLVNLTAPDNYIRVFRETLVPNSLLQDSVFQVGLEAHAPRERLKTNLNTNYTVDQQIIVWIMEIK